MGYLFIIFAAVDAEEPFRNGPELVAKGSSQLKLHRQSGASQLIVDRDLGRRAGKVVIEI